MRIDLKSISLTLRIFIISLVISTKILESPFRLGIWISLSISIITITILASRFKEKILEFDVAFIKQITQIILTACFIFAYVAFFPFFKIFERQVKKRAEQKIDLAFFDFKSPYKLEVQK